MNDLWMMVIYVYTLWKQNFTCISSVIGVLILLLVYYSEKF